LNFSTSKDLIVFIRGFNVAFDGAAKTAATLSAELAVPTVFFSWSSAASLTCYQTDEACVEVCAYQLANFLRECREGCTGQVHIIAHSMGNRALIRALPCIESGKQFGQITFAAADVDSQLFRVVGEQIFTNRMAEAYTIYTAKKDRALGYSGWLHTHPRVGRHLPYTVLDNVSTVAADDVLDEDNTDKSIYHGYYVASKAVLEDLRFIVGSAFSRAVTRRPIDEHVGVYEIISN
jgi:esterase/lipase superfamily enzyme